MSSFEKKINVSNTLIFKTEKTTPPKGLLRAMINKSFYDLKRLYLYM